MHPKIASDLYQQWSGHQQKNNLASVFRHVEGAHSKGFCSHGSPLRDPSLDERLESEEVSKTVQNPSSRKSRLPCLQTPRSRDGTFRLRWQLATESTKFEAIHHQLLLWNNTAIITTEDNKFFDSGGKQNFRALPSRPIFLPGRA